MRDNFTKDTKTTLAMRVGGRCSNPYCPQATSGPHSDPTKATNVGVAAHIAAASPGGKRYDPRMTPEERKSIENGIWLCQKCAKLIDSDEAEFALELLNEWKDNAELKARSNLDYTDLQATRIFPVSEFQDRVAAALTESELVVPGGDGSDLAGVMSRTALMLTGFARAASSLPESALILPAAQAFRGLEQADSTTRLAQRYMVAAFPWLAYIARQVGQRDPDGRVLALDEYSELLAVCRNGGRASVLQQDGRVVFVRVGERHSEDTVDVPSTHRFSRLIADRYLCSTGDDVRHELTQRGLDALGISALPSHTEPPAGRVSLGVDVVAACRALEHRIWTGLQAFYALVGRGRRISEREAESATAVAVEWVTETLAILRALDESGGLAKPYEEVLAKERTLERSAQAASLVAESPTHNYQFGDRPLQNMTILRLAYTLIPLADSIPIDRSTRD